MKKLLPLLALLVLFSACNNGGPEGKHNAPDAATTTDATSDADRADASDEASVSGNSQSRRESPGQLTAGEWRDAAHWDFWQSLMKEDIYGDMPGYWKFNLNNRLVVKAETRGAPAVDAPVTLRSEADEVLWEGRTDNQGTAYLFPRMNGDGQGSQASGLKVEVDDAVIRKASAANDDGVLRISVPESGRQPKALLEAAFMVDATGSMGDEMAYLKAELTDVIQRVKDDNRNLDIRTGAVFYRDEGDDFLTRKLDFTDDVSETVGFIRRQNADGGGDFPEAVHTALDVALNDLEWSDDARARLLFLVLDAPPHHDAAIVRKVNRLVALAARKGVRLIPVVSSGIDKETEFLMRYMAIATGGTYLFLTDDSGIGNSHLQPTIGKYEVEYLNDLLVRVIDGYVGEG